MPQLRVGLAQIDTTVGDFTGNAAAVRHWASEAQANGAQIAIFPEMTLTGYPPEDLVLRRSFVDASEQAMVALARDLATDGLGQLVAVVGYATRNPDHSDAWGSPLARNSAAVLFGGEIVATYSKFHLPNYGVFDEDRYFTRGLDFPVLRIHGVDVGLTICEDVWQDGGPFAVARAAGVGLVLCLNASPYERGKLAYREDLVARRARESDAPIAFANMVGGQDELIFDGASMIVDARGLVVARAPQFETGLMVVDLELAGPTDATPDAAPVEDLRADATKARLDMTISPRVLSTDPLPAWPPMAAGRAERLEDLDEVWAALVMGTRDYVEKNGFRSVVLGLSGGIDSALTATIAVDALGGDRVHTVALPSSYSSEHSLSDAADLARRQGTQHRVVAIGDMVDAYRKAVTVNGLAEENLQARVRGTTWMAISNQEGHLVLTAGNKSELATGFSTLYGDSAGGFAPLKDVPKTLVWALARRRNEVAALNGQEPPIPEASITKAPSAELAPGQLDADRLPDYELLDAVLEDYVVRDLGRDELIKRHDPVLVDRVVRLVDLAEYKRRQYPPGPKITPKAFGRDRRLPITSQWREGPS